MKKIIITAFMFSVTCVANAQLKEALIKKVGEKAKNKNEKTTDKKTTESTESGKTEDKKEEKAEEKKDDSGNGAVFSMGGKKEIKPKYEFQQSVLMDMKHWDKKGKLEEKKSTQSRFYYSNTTYNAVENIDKEHKNTSFGIFESETSQMIMLMDDGTTKMAMVTKINSEKFAEKASEENKNYTVNKTGRTKKICGYTCEEWVSTDEKGNKNEMWVSNEVPIKTSGAYTMFGPQNKEMSKYMKGDMSKYPSGMMLEITSYQSNGEKFTMTAVEINLKENKVIETSGYQVF